MSFESPPRGHVARPRPPVDDAESTASVGGVGQYRYDLATGSWWWSSETFHIHGFEPHEVVPTTQLVLAHKHPEDRGRFQRLLDEASRTGAPFTSTHRILDAQGFERIVCVIGQGRRDASTGEVAELMGYFTDITSVVTGLADQTAGEHIRASAVHRATIEQGKGVLSATLGVSIDDAFALLRTVSNNHNVPVRTLAGWIIDLTRVPPIDEDRRRQLEDFLHTPYEPL